ncbi:MAG: tyrosine-protein phosphatase [Clostridia bacterium]|nr:tyrosine-protein phosphatase [Clostridia bacterium]
MNIKTKLVLMLSSLCLACTLLVFGVFALNRASLDIGGTINFVAPQCDVEYALELHNAATTGEYSTVAPAVRYFNSNNTAAGELVKLSDTTKNVEFGDAYFSSHKEYIPDIEIKLTLKNNSKFPVVVNFSFGQNNNIGLFNDFALKEVYLSEDSQKMGYSSVMGQGQTKKHNFSLVLSNPTSDLSSKLNFDLNVAISLLLESSNEITTTDTTQPISMVNDIVTIYLKTAETTAINEIITSYETRMDICKPFVFEYSTNYSVKNAIFEIATSQDFSNSKSFILNSNSISLQNLLINTNYYYRLTLIKANDVGVYTQGVITTAKTPRILTIDGVYNVRDIGGWQTSANIKQGLLFRGTEIDGVYEKSYCATANGIKQLKDLSVLTDFDLRNTYSASPINCEKLYFAAPMYEATFESGSNTVVKNMFTELSKPKNYPMYLHCTYGCDRTGTICYLLEALLGVNENELIIDYELSSLAPLWATRDNNSFVAFVNKLKSYTGDNLQQKTQSYLTSIGITEQQIQSIKDIFLD